MHRRTIRDASEEKPRSSLSLATLEYPLQNSTASKSRGHARDGSVSRPERELESPEKRVAARKSSLATAPGQASDDPFLPSYSRSSSKSSASSRQPRSRHRRSSKPDPTVTVEPLDFNDLEEGDVAQSLRNPVEQTPRVHRRRTRSPTPKPSRPITPDGPMDDAPVAQIFDPVAFARLTPTGRDDNPHFKLYPAFVPDGPEEANAAATLHLNAGNLPVLVMALETALANVDDTQVKYAKENPDRCLLLIPFNGGNKFHKTFPNASADFTKVLIPVTGDGGVTVFPPKPKQILRGGGSDGQYLPPYPLFVECKTPEISRKLVRHGVITVDRRSAAHVLPMNGGRLSWSLGHFKCRAGSGAGLAAFAEQFLVAVAATCYAPGLLRNKILWLTQHNTEIPADERVYTFIGSLDVVFQASETEPLLTLYGRPCSDSFAMWESLRRLFWDTKFTMGLAEFTPVSAKPRGSETRTISLCWLCKLDDHRSRSCPYVALSDWQGPNQVLNEKDGVQHASGRGGRGYYRSGLRNRGRGRGAPRDD
ncbi:hypothetical protein B0H13DRAFT_1852017 [Mycena leptocephala]|nr:hypothetical protein B0H13DRAFT_1852017 [Mycena leptocephala]